MSDNPLMPKIVQPLCFSLRSLKNYTPRKQNVKQETYPRLNMMESLKTAGMKCDTVRVNVLTPSPERALPNKPEVTVISDDSDVEDLPPYSLPPTPSISDDSDDLFVLSCLPKVKSVISLREERKDVVDNSSLVLIPTVKSVTTVRETEEIPNNLRVHPCHWNECHMSCETAETLHKHILAQHSTVEDMSCAWLDCSVYGKKFRNVSLFGRHIQSHTGALNFACIWEGCTERFREDKYLQAHVSTHLREKKKNNNEKKKKKKEEEQAKQIARSHCIRKRRLLSHCPVTRQNFSNILDERGIDKQTMRKVRKKVRQIQHCTDSNRTIELTAEIVGHRQDPLSGKQWLLQAKRDRAIMRWSTNKNAKINVPWKYCPEDVLVQLGLLAKQPRRRKQRKTVVL